MADLSEAIYVRQSKDKKDSLSIKGQIDLCRHECSHPESALIYEDKGFSGKNTQRPGFQSMLKDVKEGKISKIIVYRLDRLSRSIIDFGQLWNELEKNQVEFVSVNEKFDTATPMGRAMIYIIMVFAQLERETIGERVTDNYYTRIRQGNWPGGPAPYGMVNVKIKKETGGTVPSLDYTDEFEVVKEIFYRYALEDISLGMIASDLTERGIPCKKRAAWDNVALSRILHSPVYVRADQEIYYYYKRRGIKRFSNAPEDFDGTCSAHVVGKRTGNVRKYTNLQNHVISLTNFPGRIPSEIWLACQHKLEQNRQVGNAGKGKHSWLTGLLKCGECGYSLTVRKWRDKKYLYCSGRGNLHICSKKSFHQKPEEIEYEVQKELEKILEECNREQLQMPDGEKEKQRQQEIQEINEKISRLLGLMAEASEISMKYINQELEALDARRTELMEAYSLLDNSPPAPLGACITGCPDGYKYPDRKRNDQGIIFGQLEFEQKKLTAQAFIEKIKVYDDSIEITWKI